MKNDKFHIDEFQNDEFQSDISKSGCFSFDHDDLAEITNHITTQVQKSASQNAGSKLMCIVEKIGTGYTLRSSDGFDILGAIAIDITDWTQGTWVTAEQTLQGWVIAGIGAFDGGSLPDQAG